MLSAPGAGRACAGHATASPWWAAASSASSWSMGPRPASLPGPGPVLLAQVRYQLLLGRNPNAWWPGYCCR
jgi:hypothetical protein